jgi:hypothetical protein
MSGPTHFTQTYRSTSPICEIDAVDFPCPQPLITDNRGIFCSAECVTRALRGVCILPYQILTLPIHLFRKVEVYRRERIVSDQRLTISREGAMDSSSSSLWTTSRGGFPATLLPDRTSHNCLGAEPRGVLLAFAPRGSSTIAVIE